MSHKDPDSTKAAASQQISAETSIDIRKLNLGYSPRLAGENTEHIRSLVELTGDLPSILVHRPTMRVIDGAHRLRAAILRGDSTITARFFDGSETDAFILAVEANITHGLPLARDDRIAAATRIVQSHPQWSDRAIAARAGLSAKTVATIRSCSTDATVQLNRRRGLDGKERPVDITAARRRAAELIEQRPEVSLREIARTAGISPATAKDVRARVAQGEGPIPLGQQRRKRPAPSPRAVAMSGQSKRMRLLRTLQRDPSLRSTDIGKKLLKMFPLHLIDPVARRELVAGIPPHSIELIARSAAEFADAWQEFSTEMRQRKG